MNKIVCTFHDFDRFCGVFRRMCFRANGFVPTEDELEQEVLPNLKDYILFLLWIMETGTETEENTGMRRKIQTVLNEHFKLVESAALQEA